MSWHGCCFFKMGAKHRSRSLKPPEILVPLDAPSKPGASSVVGARRPCPYFENTPSNDEGDDACETPPRRQLV